MRDEEALRPFASAMLNMSFNLRGVYLSLSLSLSLSPSLSLADKANAAFAASDETCFQATIVSGARMQGSKNARQGRRIAGGSRRKTHTKGMKQRKSDQAGGGGGGGGRPVLA